MRSGESCAKSIFQIYSTLERKYKHFGKNLNDIYSWYACGPTVYDLSHIGHAKTYVQFDVIRKIFKKYGINFIQAMSITDIDDKIIKRSNESNIPVLKLSNTYEELFFKEMQKLNVEPPDIKLRVSEYIIYIQKYINSLIINGTAYLSHDGSVYFNLGKYKQNYGQFRQTNLNEEISSPSTDAYDRRNKADFVLWKACKTPHEIGWLPKYWDSKVKGRPGWHIECSVMSNATFGPHIDIHTGGHDLIFPHHENELAQCMAFYQTTPQQGSTPSLETENSSWVDIWMHTGHLRNSHEQDKMSKSLKNTIPINELIGEGKKYTSDHFRLMCLANHYRKGLAKKFYCALDLELAFDPSTTMKVYERMLEKIDDFLYTTKTYSTSGIENGDETHQLSIDEPHLEKCLADTQARVNESLTNDFDTPSALNALLNLIDETRSAPKPKLSPPLFYSRAPYVISKLHSFVENTLRDFGLTFQQMAKYQSSNDREKQLLNEAIQFRGSVREVALEMSSSRIDIKAASKRLLTASDNLRHSYQNYGVDIKDVSKNSSSWKYSRDQNNDV